MPDFREYAVEVSSPGEVDAEATRIMGNSCATCETQPREQKLSIFSPDENNSNRWQDTLEVTNRAWVADRYPYDDHLAPDGRVMEMLERTSVPGLAGGLSVDRSPRLFFLLRSIHSYHRLDVQSAREMAQSEQRHCLAPADRFAQLSVSSHVWRQDHNGFSHQDPGFIDHVVNKKAEVVRVYLPPDANSLLSVTDHCLRSRNYVNVIVAGKQPAPQWLNMDQAIKHCTAGHRHLGMGQQRPRERAGRGHGLLW